MWVEVLGGVERRRRWSHDEKRRINNMTDFEVWHMEGNGGEWRGLSKMDKMEKMDKNDRKYEQFASVPQLIETYGKWVQSLFDDGFRMYLVKFKFNHIPGSSDFWQNG